ncbi:MAG: universal stress protein [Lewinellaceae bacterium]|nr:universal stress protein [Lewinellaceae bacterium]
MKKILVPIDFSDASVNALKVACQLALRFDAGLYLLHVNEMIPYVIPVTEYAYTATAVDIETYNKEKYEHIQQLKKNVLREAPYSNLDITVAVEAGVMVPVVKKVAEEEFADLIVMGTLGASGWREVLVGSNTERVIRHAPCPVLVIPEGVRELTVERVLVPTTLKPDQIRVFKTAKAWQEFLGFDVEALYVGDPLNAGAHGNVESEKNRLTEETGLRHVYLHLNTLDVKVEDAIRTYAKQAEAGLIIMGTYQRHGLSHLLFGSLTENTANHAHVPVLAVPVA